MSELTESRDSRVSNAMSLDLQGILEYQQNRSPYLMIDGAHEIIPGVSAKGFKNLTNDDWFFPCHFPNDPNMPGMLQIEAIIQLCALTILTLPGNKGKVAYVVTARNLKFKRKVLPGDRLDIEALLHSWKRGVGQCSGKSFVCGELASEAEFSIVLPEILARYKISM